MKHVELELETPYQVTPLPLSNGQAVHRIAISARAGAVQVSLDPNICQLDPFGDTAACTRIAIRVFEAKLSLLEERDGRRLFALEPRSAEEPALRLVLHPAGAIKAVVALE